MYKKIFRIVILTVTVGILAGILCGCGRLRGVQKGSSSDGVHSGSESGVTWRITEDGTLFIEGEKIAGEPDPIGQQWQQYRDDFTKVVITAENIESTMTWFSDCSNITEVDMSEFDTGKVTDAEDMFGGCESIYWIKTFPNLQLQIALPLETMYDEADDEYQYFPVGLPEGIELTD